MTPKQKTVKQSLREDVERELNQKIRPEVLKKEEVEWDNNFPVEGQRWININQKKRKVKITREREGE
jgi:hypothetical protein